MTELGSNRSLAICGETPGRGWQAIEDQLARAEAQDTDPLRLVEIEDALRAIHLQN